MKRGSNHAYKIFPFAPGLTWKIKHWKYVIPNQSLEILYRVLKDKKIITVAYGGLLESFCSLALLEIYNYLMPKNELYWAGHSKFIDLLSINGLAKYYELNQELTNKFPTPLFFDKKDKAYLNCLKNIYVKISLNNRFEEPDRRIIFKQIFEKSLVPWNIRYLPKLRNNEMPIELQKWAKISNFYFNKPYVIIFPDIIDISIHNNKCLNWNGTQVKALAAMLKQKGISTLIVSNAPTKYLDYSLFTIPFNIKFMCYLLSKAHACLAEQIDFLLITNLISEAKIFALPQKKEFHLEKNNKFIDNKSWIYTQEGLSPIDVYNKIIESQNG